VTGAAALRGPAGVLAVILLELAFGSLAVLVVSPVWGVVKRGYFLLVGWTAAVCALLARLALIGPLSHVHAANPGPVLWQFPALCVATVVMLHRMRPGRPTIPARVMGCCALVSGCIGFVVLARLRADGGSLLVGTVAMLAGAAFLGATSNSMLLGHWYLVDRKLTNDPMRWHAWAFTAGIALALVSAAVAKGGPPTSSEASLNPLLLVSNLTLYLAFGLVAVCALLSFFVHKLVNEGSIRAATGMLYLAVIMALSAEFAAKARFFTV
jgi:hypothetical protein